MYPKLGQLLHRDKKRSKKRKRRKKLKQETRTKGKLKMIEKVYA